MFQIILKKYDMKSIQNQLIQMEHSANPRGLAHLASSSKFQKPLMISVQD